jgi:hypothetical protein
MKRCSCCGEWFPKTDFGGNRQTPDGLAYYTRAHAAQKQKDFRRTNPESVAASRKNYLDKLRKQNDPAYAPVK